MNFTLHHQRTNTLPLRSRIGGDTGLYCGTVGLMHFLRFILRISFYYSVKVVNSIRLFLCREVFALFFMQSDKRKPSVVLFRLHRLIYFTRAVCLPALVEATAPKRGVIRVASCSCMQPPFSGNIRIVTI